MVTTTVGHTQRDPDDDRLIAKLRADLAEVTRERDETRSKFDTLTRGLARLMVSIQRNAPPVLVQTIFAFTDVPADPMAEMRQRAEKAEADLAIAQDVLQEIKEKHNGED